MTKKETNEIISFSFLILCGVRCKCCYPFMANDEWKGHPVSKILMWLCCILVCCALIDGAFLVGHYSSIGGWALYAENGKYYLDGTCLKEKADRNGRICETTQDVYVKMAWHQNSIFLLAGIAVLVAAIAIALDDKWRHKQTDNKGAGTQASPPSE